VCGVIDGLGLERVLGVGHSMGGHAVVLAAAARPDRFRGLLLVDPVIVAPEIGALVAGGVSAESHPIRRRRNRWDSAQEMFDSFRAKEPYSRWDAGVLMDYCRYGLEPAEGGGYVLACPPDLEAEVYAGAGTSDIYALLPRVRVPVEIIRARARRPDESLFDFSGRHRRGIAWPRSGRTRPTSNSPTARISSDGAPALDGGAHRACCRRHALMRRSVAMRGSSQTP
jgi:pimeloyl-ACP methyl ester carboxylesterase